MARPVYPYELHDPDFCWLIDNFRENNPQYIMYEDTCLPLVFIETGGIAATLAGLPFDVKEELPFLAPRETGDDEV
jgi:hypothetical protein